MLVQKALRELDEEIDRLTRIRNIVAVLHTTISPTDLSPDASEVEVERPMILRKPARKLMAIDVPPEAEAMAESATPVTERVARAGRRLRMERSVRTRRVAPPAARALGGDIPVRPVFIASGSTPPVKVATSVKGKPDSPNGNKAPSAPEGGLDALLRELAHRPMPGM